MAVKFPTLFSNKCKIVPIKEQQILCHSNSNNTRTLLLNFIARRTWFLARMWWSSMKSAFYQRISSGGQWGWFLRGICQIPPGGQGPQWMRSSLVQPAAALLLSPSPAHLVLRPADSHSTGQQILGNGRRRLASLSSSGSLDDRRESWRSSGLSLCQETAGTRTTSTEGKYKYLTSQYKDCKHSREQFYHHPSH